VFRVFRLDGEGEPSVYRAPDAKTAVRAAAGADTRPGQVVYEAHAVRNASVHQVESRDERYVDSIRQVSAARRRSPRPSVAETEGDMTCTSRGETKSVRKFPTINSETGKRGTECRDCRDKRRAASNA
jgi:hypothetical protein